MIKILVTLGIFQADKKDQVINLLFLKKKVSITYIDKTYMRK